MVLTTPAATSSVDVQGVGIGVVLDAGGGPERALRVGAERGQLLPSLAGDDFLIGLVGQPGVGDSRLSLELRGLAVAYLVEPASTSVSTREMKKEATERMAARSRPAAAACSRPPR